MSCSGTLIWAVRQGSTSKREKQVTKDSRIKVNHCIKHNMTFNCIYWNLTGVEVDPVVDLEQVGQCPIYFEFNWAG